MFFGSKKHCELYTRDQAKGWAGATIQTVALFLRTATPHSHPSRASWRLASHSANLPPIKQSESRGTVRRHKADFLCTSYTFRACCSSCPAGILVFSFAFCKEEVLFRYTERVYCSSDILVCDFAIWCLASQSANLPATKQSESRGVVCKGKI